MTVDRYETIIRGAAHDQARGKAKHVTFAFPKDADMVDHLRVYFEGEGHSFDVSKTLEGGNVWGITVTFVKE